jgi:hypothetical protein
MLSLWVDSISADAANSLFPFHRYDSGVFDVMERLKASFVLTIPQISLVSP